MVTEYKFRNHENIHKLDAELTKSQHAGKAMGSMKAPASDYHAGTSFTVSHFHDSANHRRRRHLR
jgi:hypothetical protein